MSSWPSAAKTKQKEQHSEDTKNKLTAEDGGWWIISFADLTVQHWWRLAAFNSVRIVTIVYIQRREKRDSCLELTNSDLCCCLKNCVLVVVVWTVGEVVV